MNRFKIKQSPDFPLSKEHCKLSFGMRNLPMSSNHRDEMEDQDIKGCETSLSGPGPLSTSPSNTVQETRDTVEELTVKNMHNSAMLCSMSSSTSRLALSQHFYPVFSEMRSSLVIQDRARMILRLGQYHSMIPPQPSVPKPLLETHGSLGPLEETDSSSQQQPSEDSCRIFINDICEGKPEFTHGGMSLRALLSSRYSRGIDKTEGLQLFRQIVELVDFAHSQDIILQELRPSRFILLPSNKVKYVGSSMRNTVRAALMNSDSKRKRLWLEVDINAHPVTGIKHQKISQEVKTSAELQYSTCTESQAQGSFSTQSMYGHHPVIVQLEEEWYNSPEQCNQVDCGIPSNIYGLGVLLFELLCSFESHESHHAAMSDLQSRILPSRFLSENPKEAGFCLWFLHPEHLSRPTTREILQSGLFHGPLESYPTNRARISSDENCAELELLLHFLASLKEQKIRHELKLIEDISHIEEDLKEIQRNSFPMTLTCPSFSANEERRWMRSINQLEESYFSMRSQPQMRETSAATDSDRDLLRNQERWSGNKSSNKLGPFFDALCKFARYSKFEVCGSLKCGDLLNAANVIRSIGFNRDEDYIATAGVSKKIKVFEFSTLLDDSIDIHYPAVEMSNKSKLSCVCWNGYTRGFLASTDYDGLVQIWDVGTARSLSQYSEHQKRAWCVDFCQVDPTRFASGSDDCSVKLWRINERNSIGTIWNPANVCSVQFSAHSTNLLTFGCADNNIYCYDLRNTRVPWCTLSGHSKTVSYVKFLDFETIVSASTDNSLKMWNLKGKSSDGSSSYDCSITFKGHTNEKNFVGLSVFDGYIACGSETNEVYCYYKSLPVPITSHKFGPTDPASEGEIGSDERHFVSSVCWGRRTNTVVAANSAGSLKVLQMV